VTDATHQATNSAKSWQVVGRVQEFEGERRANLLRIAGIAGFYAIELMNRYGLDLGFIEVPALTDVDRKFHVAVTSAAVVWVMLALAVELCLRNRIFPSALMYASTAGDLVLLTGVLCVADGPKSPLVVGYFLVLGASALRLSLPLVWFATIATLASYLVLSGFARWYTDRELRVPRYEQFMVLLSLALLGLMLGQVVRNAKRMAARYGERLCEAEELKP
jgi:hypothetical protein